MSHESAYFTIENLVKDFQTNEKYYISHDYSEAEARRDFIDKFFEAMGWDIYHNVQKNPYEQEVKVEKTVANESSSKRADYSFSLSPRYNEPVFYVEAKKPSKNLSNPDYYFQAIRYGWSSNTPLVVLTDFEEFHIIDSRYRPNIKTALERNLQCYHYLEYLDKEKFKRIYYLFSREAVENNGIGKYVNELKRIKGKKIREGITGIYQNIDDSFLDELDIIRNELAKVFKKNNKELGSDELTEAVQRTIDRLVFLRFLEAKLIEPENHIKQYFRKGIAWNNFIKDSKTLDSKYNGVVFKNHPLLDSETFNPPENKSFETICEKLIHENSPYDFNLIPIHILGSIYERFLGKVVHATEKQVRIEEKPEVRKAGGVYYTPQYIVKYIVDNTVGKIIEGLTPAQISKLKFGDIACGSGSFLITIFESLLKYISKWYNNNPEQAKKDKCINVNDSWLLTLEQKRNILINNIYGVDLDPQAVEVTQVSLFLKLLEDETPSSIHLSDMFLKDTILPDLSKNIKCGNSLIGTDILSNKLFENDIDEEKIKPMDFETAFPEVMKIGGFDVIVGNPPYLKLTKNNQDKIILKYFDKKFKSHLYGSSKNLFQLFIEKAISLSKHYLSYIVPEALLTTSSNEYLRKLLNNEINDVQSIVTFNHFVFQDATIGASIFVLNKGAKNQIIFRRLMDIFGNVIKETQVNNTKTLEVWLPESNGKYDLLLKRIENSKIEMKQIVNMSKGMVVKDRISVLENNKNENNLPFLLGSSIRKYFYDYKLYASYDKLEIIGGTRNFEKHIKVPRLLIRRTGDILCAVYSSKPELIESTLYILVSEKIDLFYLLGLINSSLLSFYLKKGLVTNLQGFPQILMSQLEKLPVKTIDFNIELEKSQHDKIVSLVNQMLVSKKKQYEATTESQKTYYQDKCNSLDRQIDDLVYELYGITDEERKVIEGK